MSKLNDLIKELCPNGVEFRSLKEVFDIFSGMTGVTNKWAEEGNCQFIDYMNAYKNNKIDITNLPYATVKNMNQIILAQGDLLLTSASEVPDECAIASVIEDIIQDGVFMDDHLFGLRLKDEYKNTINTTFISYYLNSKPFRCNLFKAVRGVTRFYISNKDYMKLYVPIPPIKVQEEIVRILDRFGELEAELEAELEVRESQYEFWRGKLFDNSNGKVIKLSDLCTIGDGLHGTPHYVDESEYYFINGNNLNNGKITYDNKTKKISKTDFDNQSILLNDNTLLMSINGTIGKVSYYNNEKIMLGKSVAYFNIKDENRLSKKYLYYLLQSANSIKYYQDSLTGSTILNLGLKSLREFKVQIPSIDEQKRIVSILERFDKLINDISEGLPAEIVLRKKQYEYYRNMLLSFEELKNE